MPTGEPRNETFPSLDGLRAISITLVLATHLLPLGPKPLRLNEMTGPMGMSLFFVLSGFLIVRTLRTDSVGAFVVKRLARILPLAWLYIGVVAILFRLSTPGLLASLGFTLNYQSGLMIPVTDHLWSLAVEMQFYVLVALLALLRREALPLLWVMCFGITALRVFEGATISILTHLRGDEILAGACLGTLSVDQRSRIAAPQAIWLAFVTILAITSHPESGWLQYFRPYAAMALLATTLRLRNGMILNVLCSRSLKYVATFSYALYIIHPLTAQKGWWNEGSIWLRYLFKRPIGILLTFLAAHISTFYWERRWTRAARRWILGWSQSKLNSHSAVRLPTTG